MPYQFLKWPAWLLFTFICVRSGKICQIAKPLLLNKMCGFRERYALQNFNSMKLQWATLGYY